MDGKEDRIWAKLLLLTGPLSSLTRIPLHHSPCPIFPPPSSTNTLPSISVPASQRQSSCSSSCSQTPPLTACIAGQAALYGPFCDSYNALCTSGMHFLTIQQPHWDVPEYAAAAILALLYQGSKGLSS